MVEIDGENYEFLLSVEGIEERRLTPPVDFSFLKPIHCWGDSG